MYSVQIQVPLATIASASLSNHIGLPFLVCVTRMVFPQLPLVWLLSCLPSRHTRPPQMHSIYSHSLCDFCQPLFLPFTSQATIGECLPLSVQPWMFDLIIAHLGTPSMASG